MEGKLRTVEEKVALGTVGAAAAPMCCCCKCGLSRGVVHDGCPLAPGGEGAAALRGACPPPPPILVSCYSKRTWISGCMAFSRGGGSQVGCRLTNKHTSSPSSLGPAGGGEGRFRQREEQGGRLHRHQRQAAARVHDCAQGQAGACAGGRAAGRGGEDVWGMLHTWVWRWSPNVPFRSHACAFKKRVEVRVAANRAQAAVETQGCSNGAAAAANGLLRRWCSRASLPACVASRMM